MKRKSIEVNKLKIVIAILFSTGWLNAVMAQKWKEEAWERINAHRKSKLELTVLSESGDPIAGADVSIKLKRHDFNFGAVLRSAIYNSSPYKDKYAELYQKYFNCAEFEIGMKPAQRGGYWEDQADQALSFLLDNNLRMRGHTLIWEGYNFFPSQAKAVYDDTNLSNEEKGRQLMDILDDHLYHAIPKWDVKWWDVINEPVVNNYVNNLLPEYNTFVHWFKLADSLRTVFQKDFKLVLNENQVISGNAPWVATRISDFQSIIDDMLSDSAPIEMLGFQGRIQYGMLSPQSQYERLLLFDKYDLPYQATEFEIRSSEHYTYSPEEIKQLTEETMIVYFSHPKVESFWHWTFVDDSNGSLPWALFDYDGTPKPTGEKWIELMEGEFNTNVLLKTPYSGQGQVLGYKGEYDLEVTFENQKIETSLHLLSDTAMIIHTPFVYTQQPLSLDPPGLIEVSVIPLKDEFVVQSINRIKHVTLYNVHGTKVRTFVPSASYSTQGMAYGLYVAIIETSNGIVSKKIVVK